MTGARFGLAILVLSIGAVGCSPRTRATTAASIAWSCPEDRIVLERAPAASAADPPPDIAADPARLAIWKRSASDPSETMNFSASGCGQKGTVSCFYDATPGQTSSWRCVEASSPPHSSALKTKVEEIKVASAGGAPETLEAMAKQLEALGEMDEAQRLRVRAQTLRTSGNAPAPEAAPSSTPASSAAPAP
jgi:hypothetical protein